MKTTISVPDNLFEQTENLARESRKSRSRLYADALREYIARHHPDAATGALDRVVDQIEQPKDQFVSEAARRVLERCNW